MCLAWNKNSDNLLAATCVDGTILVLSLDTNSNDAGESAITSRGDKSTSIQATTGSVRSSTGGVLGNYRTGSGAGRKGAGKQQSSNNNNNVATIDQPTIRLRSNINMPCYSCVWCPSHHSILAVGTHDGRIFLYNTLLSQQTPHTYNKPPPLALVHELRGPSSKVFNCCWSLLTRGLIAGASDDTVSCSIC